MNVDRTFLQKSLDMGCFFGYNYSYKERVVILGRPVLIVAAIKAGFLFWHYGKQITSPRFGFGSNTYALRERSISSAKKKVLPLFRSSLDNTWLLSKAFKYLMACP